jgi:UDP-glucose 4-epimerase
MKNKKILIFGASGFISTYLITELILQGCKVTASDISEEGNEYFKSLKIDFIKIDITSTVDFEKLNDKEFDVVVHLAACQPANISKKNYKAKEYINVNVNGTLNILEYCRKMNIKKIIYASSHRNTQGLWKSKRPIKEEDGRSIKYDGEYAMFSISESAAQDSVLHYQAQYGLLGLIFRLPPVYGYGPHTEIFKNGKPIKTGFQAFIDNATQCRPLEVWGDPDLGRDIIYVKDVVNAFIKAINKPNVNGLYNITSGNYLTLREQAQIIAKIFWGNDDEPKIIFRPEIENGMESFVYDISKAKHELGWYPLYNFTDMLVDFQKEAQSKKYKYLIDKRKKMMS